jgi:hypothetical protein
LSIELLLAAQAGRRRPVSNKHAGQDLSAGTEPAVGRLSRFDLEIEKKIN